MQSKKALEILLDFLGVENQGKKVQKLEDYTELILKWNRKFNITSIKEPDEVILKHHIDSIALNAYLNLTDKKVVDIGTGAGLPGIPLKIINPSLYLTLIESRRKKINFLKMVENELELEDIEVLPARAEEVGLAKDYRESHDFAFSRAVGNINVLMEYGLPLINTSGLLVCWESGNVNEQLKKAKSAMNLLNASYEKKLCYGKWLQELVGKYINNNRIDENKQFVFIKKLAETPKEYPRKPGIPKKRPL